MQSEKHSPGWRGKLSSLDGATLVLVVAMCAVGVATSLAADEPAQRTDSEPGRITVYIGFRENILHVRELDGRGRMKDVALFVHDEDVAENAHRAMFAEQALWRRKEDGEGTSLAMNKVQVRGGWFPQPAIAAKPTSLWPGELGPAVVYYGLSADLWGIVAESSKVEEECLVLVDVEARGPRGETRRVDRLPLTSQAIRELCGPDAPALDDDKWDW